jgi:hypothetical protein
MSQCCGLCRGKFGLSPFFLPVKDVKQPISKRIDTHHVPHDVNYSKFLNLSKTHSCKARSDVQPEQKSFKKNDYKRRCSDSTETDRKIV